jgi:hypothetical protein
MSMEELQEIMRATLKGLEDGKISAAEAGRINGAAELILSGQVYLRRAALAILRDAYEKVATPYEG